MSSYTVAKAVIDALVTAAVKWSEESSTGFRYHWHHGARGVDDQTATAVGQMLWHANWYHAEGWVRDSEWAQDDIDELPEEPVYEYEPLPGVPAPLVVLRLIDNYVYQTAGEPEEWRPTEPFGFVHALRDAAISRLPGYHDLPWTIGDGDRDIYLRLGGPEPEAAPLPVDTDDPAWVELDAQLAGTGIPFESVPAKERRRRAEQLGEPMLRGEWFARLRSSPYPPVGVALYANDEEARLGFDRTVEMRSASHRISVEVLRRGRTVVTLTTDHGNATGEEWIARSRNLFLDADATKKISLRQPG